MTDKMKEVIQNRSFEEFPCKWSHPITFGNPSPPEDENEDKRRAFVRGMNWYRNNVWHDVDEPPICGDSLVTAIIVIIKNKRSIFPYFLIKGTLWSEIAIHDEIDKWAYSEDLLPDNIK